MTSATAYYLGRHALAIRADQQNCLSMRSWPQSRHLVRLRMIFLKRLPLCVPSSFSTERPQYSLRERLPQAGHREGSMTITAGTSFRLPAGRPLRLPEEAATEGMKSCSLIRIPLLIRMSGFPGLSHHISDLLQQWPSACKLGAEADICGDCGKKMTIAFFIRCPTQYRLGKQGIRCALPGATKSSLTDATSI